MPSSLPILLHSPVSVFVIGFITLYSPSFIRFHRLSLVSLSILLHSPVPVFIVGFITLSLLLHSSVSIVYRWFHYLFSFIHLFPSLSLVSLSILLHSPVPVFIVGLYHPRPVVCSRFVTRSWISHKGPFLYFILFFVFLFLPFILKFSVHIT